MGMKGNLQDMTVADLIQLHCNNRKTAKLDIQNSDQQTIIFFKDGAIRHASCGDQEGEEVIYKTLIWEQGSFTIQNDIEAPKISIKRSWSELLLEGARRHDEFVNAKNNNNDKKHVKSEVNKMPQKFDEILAELAGEVTGYGSSALVGIDGINVASNSNGKLDPETVSAQMTMLFKLVDGSVTKLRAGTLEDNLTTTEKAYILMRFLPGKDFYLSIAADRNIGNVGNMRLISKMYAERLAKAMPH
jgi:predicted regulator of Ras-like GTPase activity (Roadblock/LC7/MglB family)